MQRHRLGFGVRALGLTLALCMGIESVVAAPSALALPTPPIQSAVVGPDILLQIQAAELAAVTTTRFDDTPGMDPLISGYVDILKTMIDSTLTGNESSKREAYFKLVKIYYCAVALGMISALGAGTGIGALVGVCFDAVGVGPGALIGLCCGFAVDGVVGIPAILAGIVVSIYIEEKVASISPEDGTRRLASRYCALGDAQAGPNESWVINFLEVVFNDKVTDLAQRWDTMPGLSNDQRQFLRDHNALKPLFEKVAYIKKNHRFSPKSPVAQPMSGFLLAANKLLTADTEAMQQLWLSLFGLSSMTANLQAGNLQVNPPAGAPRPSAVSLPAINVTVGGDGGSGIPNPTNGKNMPNLSASLTPGDFNVAFGQPSLENDRIKVGWKVASESTLAKGSIKGKAENREKELGSFEPKLTSDLTGSVTFQVQGHGLAVDRVEIGNVSFSANLPSLPKPFSDLSDKLAQGVTSELNNIASKLDLKRAIGTALSEYPAQKLLVSMQQNSRPYGAVAISAVQSLSMQAGKLRASVQESVLDTNVPGTTPQQFVANWNYTRTHPALVLKAQDPNRAIEKPNGPNLKDANKVIKP